MKKKFYSLRARSILLAGQLFLGSHHEGQIWQPFFFFAVWEEETLKLKKLRVLPQIKLHKSTTRIHMYTFHQAICSCKLGVTAIP